MSNYEGDAPARSIDESLHKLGTDYIDLMLLHQPFGDRYNAYRALESALKAGKVRAIGVSNFYPDHLIDLCHFVDIVPTVNQVETHVFFQQTEARKYMDERGVRHMSWGPLAEGKNGFFTNETLAAIGAKHGKTGPQVALRYLLQRDVIIIPKSVHRERMVANLDILDFQLDDADLAAIAALDEGKSLFIDHTDPESVKLLLGYLSN